MKLGAWRDLTALLDDDTEIWFDDPIFTGEWRLLENDGYEVRIVNNRVVIRPPFWEEVD